MFTKRLQPSFNPHLFILLILLIHQAAPQQARPPSSSQKLYALQIVQIPSTYAQNRQVFTRQQIVNSLENHFDEFLKTRTFFFRNSGSNPTTPEDRDPDPDPEPTPPSGNTEPNLQSPINVQRNYLLKLLNQMRAENGAKPLYLDDKLNAISQQHSRDMLNRRFFDHVNPNGQSPTDRARKNGFNAVVGENIAISSSLSRVHQQLKDSRGHFNNSINKSWTRVGFGIVVYGGYQLYLTVMFSVRDYDRFPITQQMVSNLQRSLVSYIISRNPYIRSENNKLSSDIRAWLYSNRRQQIFPYLFSRGHNYAMYVQYVTRDYSDSIVEQIGSRNYFAINSPTYNRVGVGIHLGKNGSVTIYAVYSR